jgi:hypothetical protein
MKDLSYKQISDTCAWFAANATNTSAMSCVRDAFNCLRSIDHGHYFPFYQDVAEGLPQSWTQSAAAWLVKAAQHEFGFNVPEALNYLRPVTP